MSYECFGPLSWRGLSIAGERDHTASARGRAPDASCNLFTSSELYLQAKVRRARLACTLHTSRDDIYNTTYDIRVKSVCLER